MTFNHLSSFWNLIWNFSWKIRLSFWQWYFDTPNRIHVRFRSEDRIKIKILDWGLFEKAKRKWGSIMPSKIQQSAMGLGSRYPLFENDFMQHGVCLHFRSTDSTQIIEYLNNRWIYQLVNLLIIMELKNLKYLPMYIIWWT